MYAISRLCSPRREREGQKNTRRRLNVLYLDGYFPFYRCKKEHALSLARFFPLLFERDAVATCTIRPVTSNVHAHTRTQTRRAYTTCYKTDVCGKKKRVSFFLSTSEFDYPRHASYTMYIRTIPRTPFYAVQREGFCGVFRVIFRRHGFHVT